VLVTGGAGRLYRRAGIQVSLMNVTRLQRLGITSYKGQPIRSVACAHG